MKGLNVILISLALSLNLCQSEKLMIIMLDGFRWDYVDRMDPAELPNFNRIISEGARAEYVQPIFPSMSWPSWTTIATGLTAERHGIVGNYIYNRETGLTFGMSWVDMRDPSWWDQHIPLWISATNEGLRASLYSWGLCDVPFNGVLPEKCISYADDGADDLEVFGDHLISAATDLANGFDLTMAYYLPIDTLGHTESPDGLRVYQEVAAVDAKLGDFMTALEDLGIDDEVNIVIVADHGMTPQEGNMWMVLTHYLDPDLIEIAVEKAAFTHIALTDPSRIDEAMAQLTGWPGMDIYKKEDIPDHFHFRDNDLILDILVVSRDHAKVGTTYDYADKFLPPAVEGDGVFDFDFDEGGGHHGWDDTSPAPSGYEEGPHPDMRAIFFARGPSFKQGFVNPWIKLTDEYQVFTQVLGIQGEEHEGDPDRVAGMFA